MDLKQKETAGNGLQREIAHETDQPLNILGCLDYCESFTTVLYFKYVRLYSLNQTKIY